MEKAKIIVQNEDASKVIEFEIIDEGNGMRINVEFGPGGSEDHKKGLYVALTKMLIDMFN
jgi:hypothetical protein